MNLDFQNNQNAKEEQEKVVFINDEETQIPFWLKRKQATFLAEITSEYEVEWFDVGP